MDINHWWVSVFAILIAAVSFYFTIQFAQKEATAKANSRTDHVVLTLQKQNAALVQQSKDLSSVCISQQNTWDTFQRVIRAATNPPSWAGLPLSEEQKIALAQYKQILVDSVGLRPVC